VLLIQGVDEVILGGKWWLITNNVEDPLLRVLFDEFIHLTNVQNVRAHSFLGPKFVNEERQNGVTKLLFDDARANILSEAKSLNHVVAGSDDDLCQRIPEHNVPYGLSNRPGTRLAGLTLDGRCQLPPFLERSGVVLGYHLPHVVRKDR
jgi:hypothetical protein